MEAELRGNGLKTFTNHLRSLVEISTMITIDVKSNVWRMSSISANLAAYGLVTFDRDLFSQWAILNPTVLRQAARRINGQVMLSALKCRTIDPIERCFMSISSQLFVLRIVTKGGRERLYRMRVEETEWVNVEGGDTISFEFSTPASTSWITTINALPSSDTVSISISSEGCRMEASKGGLNSTAYIRSDDWTIAQDKEEVAFTLLRSDWLLAWKLAETEGLVMNWRVGFPSHLIIQGTGTRADFILSCILSTERKGEISESDSQKIAGTSDDQSE